MQTAQIWRAIISAPLDLLRAAARRLIPRKARLELVRRFPWLRRKQLESEGAPLPVSPLPAGSAISPSKNAPSATGSPPVSERRELEGTYPKASLVVVTYNNCDLTQQCLESIYRNTTYSSFEVIVVDNASSDATPMYLSSAAESYPNMRVLCNPTNEGFARANNKGIAAATGEYLVLLNNDIVVTPGWLERLIRHLNDPTVGLVGPVTNSAGNEARIDVSYQDLWGMEDFAARRMAAHDGEAFEIRVLALFCATMRRSLLDKVGVLDERFEVGMFEDDDFSHRIRLAGYRVMCAEDVFIHHAGRAAFAQLSEAEYKRIWDANRVRFEQKWHTTWQRHIGWRAA